MGVQIICRDGIDFKDDSLTRDDMKQKIQNASNLFISVTENGEVYDVHIPQIIYFKEYPNEES